MHIQEQIGGGRAARIFRTFAKKNKFVLLVILVGVLLLCLPALGGGGSGNQSGTAASDSTQSLDFDLEGAEEDMENALSKVDGAGDVTVVLTLERGEEQILAQDETRESSGTDSSSSSTTVIVKQGTSQEGTVVVQRIYPHYRGALVVYSGTQSAGVELELMQAVKALTGLQSDKISICSGK